VIKLLFIQALRTGNIGPSLEDVLLQASQRFDRTVQWNFPGRPVFPAMTKPAYTLLDLERAAGTQQIRKTTIQVSAAAGVLANVTAHDWRRGFARDLRYAKKPTNLGAADAGTAKAMGQTAKTLHTGVTDEYVGDLEEDTYTARASELFEGRTQPAIGKPYQPVRVTSKEVDDYCSKNNIDVKSKKGRSKAAHHIRKKHKADWMTAEKNATIPSTTAPHPSTSSVRTPSEQPAPHPSTSSVRTPSEQHMPKKRKSELSISSQSPQEEMATQAALQGAGSRVSPESAGFLSAEFLGALDPELIFNTLDALEVDEPAFQRLESFVNGKPLEPIEEISTQAALRGGAPEPELILDNMDALEVDEPAFERLESFLGGDPPEPTEAEIDQALEIMLENMELSGGTECILNTQPYEFVRFFSQINVVRNSALKPGAGLDEKLPSRVAIGNTRDYPTLYLFTCSFCNVYKNAHKPAVQFHELICKPREIKPKPFQCSRDGCTKAFA
jgi:hypothetical protein